MIRNKPDGNRIHERFSAWIRNRIFPILLCILMADLLVSFCADTSARMKQGRYQTPAPQENTGFSDESGFEVFYPVTIYPGDSVRIWIRADSDIFGGRFSTEWSEWVDLTEDPETGLFFGDFTVSEVTDPGVTELDVMMATAGGDEFGEIVWITVKERNSYPD